MQTLRLYDPERQPADWTGIIQPGQYAVFAKHIDTSGPCEPDGGPAPPPDRATCQLFDSLDEARSFSETRVRQMPGLRFEIFDATGRVNPPLLVVVHPDRASTLTGNPAAMRTRRLAAIALALASVPLFWYDYQHRGVLVLPTFLAMNMLLVAGRLLYMNTSIREVERAREARLAAQQNDRDRASAPERAR